MRRLYLQRRQCYLASMRPFDYTTAKTILDLAIIVAMTGKRVIGSDGRLPWHLSEDLQLFKRLTMGATLIMGRKTHVSIGRPLPGRTNIVLSRTSPGLPGVQVYSSFSDALSAAAQLGRPVFVVGGAQLYRKALPMAAQLHVSWVKEEHAGDVRFPAFDLADWSACEEHDYPGFCYVHYRRKSSLQSPGSVDCG